MNRPDVGSMSRNVLPELQIDNKTIYIILYYVHIYNIIYTKVSKHNNIRSKDYISDMFRLYSHHQAS
jgi:hypothetical protein